MSGIQEATPKGEKDRTEDATSRHSRFRNIFSSVIGKNAAILVLRVFYELWAFVLFAQRRFYEDRLFQSAAALTYTTLLSTVPLSAITIAILSAFPAFTSFQDEVQSLVFEAMVPEVGDAVLDQLLILAENAGRLTAFGLIGFMMTAFLLLATIESAFNSLWRVHTSRPLLIRILSFWAVLTAVPILAAFAISLTAEALAGAQVESQGLLGIILGALIVPLVEFSVLFLLFTIIPNRSVRYADSAIGAAVGTLLLEAARWGFGIYVTAAPTYDTVYGALAIVPIFLLWLYLVWSIVLIAALVAAALPDWRAKRPAEAEAPPRTRFHRLSTAVSVIDVLHGASLIGKPVSRDRICDDLRLGGAVVDKIMDELSMARFVAQTVDEKWVLSRDVRSATLWDLVESLGYDYGDEQDMPGPEHPEPVRRLGHLIDRTRHTDREILSVPLGDVLWREARDTFGPLSDKVDEAEGATDGGPPIERRAAGGERM